MTANEPTLYERLGGESGIEDLMRRFYVKVTADPLLAPFFVNVSLEKLHRLQSEFMGAALGGPQVYSGLELSWVHAGRGITTRHFNQFAQHLLATLEEIGVAADDVREVVHRISVHKNDITGEAY